MEIILSNGKEDITCNLKVETVISCNNEWIVASNGVNQHVFKAKIREYILGEIIYNEQKAQVKIAVIREYSKGGRKNQKNLSCINIMEMNKNLYDKSGNKIIQEDSYFNMYKYTLVTLLGEDKEESEYYKNFLEEEITRLIEYNCKNK